MRLLKRIKNIFYILLLLLFINCNSNPRSSRIYLYSRDKTQVITIFSDYYNNERIIAEGKLNTAPKDRYVKLNISNVTELGDEIGVCWFGKNAGWQLVNDNSKIVKVELDTTKYKIKTSWYRDENDTPNPKYYRGKNCYSIGALDYSTVHPNGNGFIERD